jgi:hypothetical protein
MAKMFKRHFIVARPEEVVCTNVEYQVEYRSTCRTELKLVMPLNPVEAESHAQAVEKHERRSSFAPYTAMVFEVGGEMQLVRVSPPKAPLAVVEVL